MRRVWGTGEMLGRPRGGEEDNIKMECEKKDGGAPWIGVVHIGTIGRLL